MRPGNVKKLVRASAAAALWFLLLILLVLAESGSPDASIHTLGDAFWYSLVTLSTVGYGDMYPVTAAGKVIGAVFVLLSVGLLAFLVSCLLAIIRGQMLPTVKLRMLRGRSWYIFPAWGDEEEAFAENLKEKDGSALLIVPGQDGEEAGETAGVLGIDAPARKILEMKGDKNCTVILMGGDSYENYSEGMRLAETGALVCCETFYEPEEHPDNLVPFHAADCCARRYWQKYPVTGSEEEFVLIGSGRYAEELLSRALLINVYGPLRSLRYHVYGDYSDYMRNHRALAKVVSISGGGSAESRDNAAQDGDSVIFHDGPWNEDPEQLRRADRVILCADDMADNLEILSRIHASFPTKAQIDCRADTVYPGIRTFGTDREIYTPEFVIRQELNRMARTMHEIYRSGADYEVAPWEELSTFLRQSNIAAADHIQTKINILRGEKPPVTEVTAAACREAGELFREKSGAGLEIFEDIEHDRWMRFHAMYNWDYSEVRDNRMRLHPDFLPFEALKPEEKKKDDYAWTLLEKLGSMAGI